MKDEKYSAKSEGVKGGVEKSFANQQTFAVSFPPYNFRATNSTCHMQSYDIIYAIRQKDFSLRIPIKK